MNRVIHFTKIRLVTYTISTVLIIGMFLVTFLVNGGFTAGIDFEPGVAVQVSVDKSVDAPIDAVRSTLEASMQHVSVQNFGTAELKGFNIRIRAYEDRPEYATEIANKITGLLGGKFGADKVTLLSKTSVGPRFSASLFQQAFILVASALVLIGVYIWIRFRLGFAMAAVVSTIHNVAFMIGFIGLTKMEITSSTVAAVLTIVGYCLNDTIVVFDRIRENEKVMADQKLGTIYDTSITQTLSRTIVTAFTVLLAVFAIYIFTHGEIKDFAEVMLLGVVVGTYSSIFIASPVLLDYRTAETKRRKLRDAKIGGKPMEQVRESVESGDVSIASAGEVDADAVAEELRRQRNEKKKF